ncbi:MAG: hypothetical protein LBD41_01235, partial [Clostridiales Family XIII bacterium]|nr:hypothetical protein [Clostridiales Family XIII bacterium]
MASLAELEKKLYEIESRNDAQLNEVVGVFSHADESFNPYTPKYRTNILLQNEKRQEADLAIDKRANSKKGLKLFILSVSFLFVF